MTNEQGRASEKKGRVKPIDVENVEFEFVREVERGNKLDEQNLTILSEPCTPHKSSLAKNLLSLWGGDTCTGVGRHCASHMGVRPTNSGTRNVPKFSSLSTPRRFR